MVVVKNQQWWTNSSPLRAILVARWSHGCNAAHIAWCSMSRAIPEASGSCHLAINCSVLPWLLSGRQETKQQWNNTPTLLAALMAVAVHRYNTVQISWWKKSRALLEATGHCHPVSICSDRSNQTCQHWFLLTWWKKAQGKRIAPNNNRGMTYQNDEKHLS